MNPFVRIAAAFATLAASSFAAAPQSTTVNVEVDPRVELMTVIFRLTGAEEFNSARTRSPYTDDVDKWFKSFRGHDAVQMAKKLRAELGIGYDTVATFALHLTDCEKVEERVPFDPIPERLADRWNSAAARGFLPSIRAFAKDSNFAGFLAAHRAHYSEVEDRMQELLTRSLEVEWFNWFFGAREVGSFIVSPGLVVGPHNFGTGVRFGGGAPEEIHPVIGAWKFDDEGVPLFDDGVFQVIVHEFCHSWANPLVDAHWAELEKSGARLFPTMRAVMERQAYTTWKVVLYESLTRAATVRYLEKHGGAAAVKENLEFDVKQHFTWIEGLAEKLGEYEKDRARWPTLDSFMPEVAKFFDALAAEAPEVVEEAPAVVSIVPENGARDVDPKTTKIVVTFDRKMRTDGYSVVGGGESFPKLAGKIEWDASGKTLTIPVALEPGHTYQFGLNGGRFTAFRSAEGVQLVPVSVEFTTRDG